MKENRRLNENLVEIFITDNFAKALNIFIAIERSK